MTPTTGSICEQIPQEGIVCIQGVAFLIEPRVAIIDALNPWDDVVEHALANMREHTEADQVGARRAPQVMYNKIRLAPG
jgi:hypothetical protein